MAKNNRDDYIRVTVGLSAIYTGLNEYRERGGKYAEATIREKGEYGTQVHRLCDAYNKSRIAKASMPEIPDDLFPDAILTYYRYVEWVEKNVVRIRKSELTVYNDEYRYQGHLDQVMLIRGDDLDSVIDLKTPVQASPTWDPQIEAYRRAYESMSKRNKTGRGFALKLSPDKPPRVCESELSRDRAFALFLYALNWKNYMTKGV